MCNGIRIKSNKLQKTGESKPSKRCQQYKHTEKGPARAVGRGISFFGCNCNAVKMQLPLLACQGGLFSRETVWFTWLGAIGKYDKGVCLGFKSEASMTAPGHHALPA